MNKQELLEKLKAELDNKLGGNWNLAINTAILFAEQLYEPATALCEIKEFEKPRYPKDKKLIKYYGCSICEYDLGSLPCDTNFCPNCGRKIKQ